MGTDKRGRIGDVIDVVLIIFISLIFITPAMLPTSSATVTPDEDFHVVTIERPFFGNVTQIAHNDEIIYIGTDSNGLVIYNQETGTFEVKNATNSFPLDSVDFVQWEDEEEMLFFTSRENIPYPDNTSIIPWVYSYDGVEVVPIGNFTYTYRPKSSMLVNDGNIFINGKYVLQDYKNTSIPVHLDDVGMIMIYILVKDSDDMLIIDNTLYTFQEVFHLDEKIAYSNLMNYNLSNNTFWEVNAHIRLLTGATSHVYALAYDHAGTVYVGSEHGILLVDIEYPDPPRFMNKTRNITMENGLISDEILDLEYSDSRNTLFASSKNGLSAIDLTTELITNIDASHGLLSNKINSIDWNEERSELYIGHDNGISILRFGTPTGIPEIQHTPVTTGTVGEKIQINATITSGNPIESAYVYYRPLEQANFSCIEMQADGNIYSAEIPALSTPGTMEYYIRAMDIYGNANSTDVYEIEVSRQDEVTQEKAGWIPGMSMNMSIIILVVLIAAGSVGVVILRKRMKKGSNHP